jgi:hypothetical protein
MWGASSRRELTEADRCQGCGEAAVLSVIAGRPQKEHLVCIGCLVEATEATGEVGQAFPLLPTDFPDTETLQSARCAGVNCSSDPLVILTYFGWEGRVRSGSSFLCRRCLELSARAMLAASRR